ncbi:MAG: poly-beta-hydroxybutyrate polymerase [Actinomycetota bacterium]|nr:poly-beta-hydroxybutyrate polymerase [Actinomycetota bacterium]
MATSRVGATGRATEEGESPELERLGAVEGLAGSLDPVGLIRSLGQALRARTRDPVGVGGQVAGHAMRMTRAGTVTVGRAFGLDMDGPATPAAKDGRFSEAAWRDNAAFYGLMQAYLLHCQLFAEMVDGAGMERSAQAKANFFATLMANALAPTNFLPTNPAALRRAAETGGLSVLRGMRNMVDDMVHNGGWPRQVDTSPFELGVNMATTPGQVVFRNDLIELIQYQPETDQTHEIPLLMGPPWINKYYIMDLAKGKSLAEWAVSHGMTTFMISYRNPDESMRDFGFDDYLLKGPRAALDVVREITGAETVNTLSVCLGATLNTALLAYLDATGESGRVNSSTTLNSLVDHSGAGTLSDVFTDEATVTGLEHKMAEKGYLDAADMARTFDLLRANDLVFSYVAKGWLCGDQPPAFDLLAWNHDSTRMPAKMHSFYLRQCWIDNALAEDRLELAGERLAVSGIDVDSYIVAAIDDHIVPWRNSYRTTQLMKADCRFVLSSSGHIAGIVNPPNPKSKLWTNGDYPADADEWLAGTTEDRETWWNDWLEWIVPRSGALGTPPPTGSDTYPALGPAPGTYVRG